MTKFGILITSALASTAFGAIGWAPPQAAVAQRLANEAMYIEYFPRRGVATLVVEVEADESVDSLDVFSPVGDPYLCVRALRGQNQGLSGFKVESRETALAQLLAQSEVGAYFLSVRTRSGGLLQGTAALSHVLPPTPPVTFPTNDDHTLPASGFTITWNTVPGAVGYRIGLEQGETDTLAVRLAAGSTSFQVPNGVLTTGAEAHLEVIAVGANGNQTVAERDFMVQ